MPFQKTRLYCSAKHTQNVHERNTTELAILSSILVVPHVAKNDQEGQQKLLSFR